MISERKLLANRLNGAKSSGPRTATGKSVSRTNALKHGLLAKLPVLARLGETLEDWESFRSAVIEDLSPNGVVQYRLAETVASLSWRLARAAKADTAVAAVAFQSAAAVEEPPKDPATRPDEAAAQVRSLRRQLAQARESAEAHERALNFYESLIGDLPDEPVEHQLVSIAWEACCRAGGWDPWFDSATLLAQFLESLGVPQSDRHGDQALIGWTSHRLRAGLQFLADQRGYALDQLPRAVAGWLRGEINNWERKARWYEAEIIRLEAEQVTKRVGTSLEASSRGIEWLPVIAGYEKHLSTELARTMALLMTLQDTRHRRALGNCNYDGESEPYG